MENSATPRCSFPFWSGELFNRGRASAAERVEIDVSHNALAGGLLCADGQWRQIVTIEDALKGGCTLFDIEQLKRENSADDFKNLFMCEFVDDKASVFPFEELQRCMVDTLEEWEDYAPFAANPFGSRPVWIGYDPSHRGDSAGCVVLAPPVVAGGKFRILERHQWKGMDFATQAESIRKLTEKYNVEYIGIDATGLGVGVFQLVRSFYPAARDIRYAPQGKADGIKIIPLSEVATKDDFFNIKKASAADLLDAHRIPFQLMGGKPENVGSLGDIEKVAKVFVRNELTPIQSRFIALNEWVGEEIIRFNKYTL